MTIFSVLYANLATGEQPIVISDVLVTSSMLDSKSEERYKKVYIPSVGGKFPHLSGNALIAGLMQKMYILDNGHFIVFAGNVGAAYDFYEAMQSIKSADEFYSACKSHRNHLQFATFAVDLESEQAIICCSDDCNILQPGSYGTVIVGGSGESTVRKLLLKHQGMPFRGDEKLTTIGRALCLVSEALELDDNFPSLTLDKSFGAYYEISLYTGDSFVKLDRVLFSFWQVEIHDDGPTWTPTKMFYHEYVNGVLVVRRISVSMEAVGRVIWQDCYGIGGFGLSTSVDFVRSQVSMSAPRPIMEVASVEFNGATFRFVAMDAPIVDFKLSGETWDINIDYGLLKKYSEEIAQSIEDLLIIKDVLNQGCLKQ